MAKEKLALRNRIIGLLLQDARERAGRTKTECAEALGISVSTLTDYEEGQQGISLPELEVLAYILKVPVDHFWDEDPQLTKEEELPAIQEVLELRHRIVGALLRQVRLDANMTQKDVAEVIGCSSSCISDYEYGKRSIPLAELELLGRHLSVPVEHFLNDQEGPIGEWHEQQEIDRLFHELPRDVQAFVTKPVNIKYLEVAMRLAEMPAGGLRNIAAGLLDITY